MTGILRRALSSCCWCNHISSTRRVSPAPASKHRPATPGPNHLYSITAMPALGRSGGDDWTSEVNTLREVLLREYGPFLVRTNAIRDRKKRPRPASMCNESQQFDLVDLDALIDDFGSSDAMARRLRNSERALRFIEWLSLRTVHTSTAEVAAAARTIALRHGLRGPLVLPPGSFPPSLLSDFERDEDDGRVDVVEEEKKEEEPAKPKKARRKQLTAAVRNAVWNSWVGIEMGVGPCHCCGRQISQQDYECGHVVAVARGGSDHPNNLRPLCRACNRSMRDEHLYEFQRRVGFADGKNSGEDSDPMDVS